MQEPGRRLPIWVLLLPLGWVGAIIVNITSTHLDTYLMSKYGEGYPMEAVLTAVGSPFLPIVVAVTSSLGVVGLWLWSQQAAPAIPRAALIRAMQPKPDRLLVGEVTWDHYSTPHADSDELHHIQVHGSLLPGVDRTVVSFRLELEGHEPVYAADARTDISNGQTYLFSAVGGSTSIARQHADWFRCPLSIPAGMAEAAWLGFIIPHEYNYTYGEARLRNPVLVATYADGSQTRTPFAPGAAPA